MITNVVGTKGVTFMAGEKKRQNRSSSSSSYTQKVFYLIMNAFISMCS